MECRDSCHVFWGSAHGTAKLCAPECECCSDVGAVFSDGSISLNTQEYMIS